MASPKPVLPSYAVNAPQPEVGNTPPQKKWRFSFQYWRQIDNFGLNRQDPNWFVSLLDRLKELSAEEEDALNSNAGKRDFYRFHQIDWSQPGIPIRRADLDWISPVYLANPDDYPIYQLTISTALGRVAGFHDENGVFQIVLLDPQHNLQPVKKFDYRVDSNWPVGNRHERVLSNIRNALNQGCNCTDCPSKQALSRLDEEFQPRGVVYISDEYIVHAEQLRSEGKIKCFEELFEANVIDRL